MAEPDKGSRRYAKKIRCAIYTRKSTEEGLDQAFNSLDAQREACAAFVVSQKHEGWSALPALYDDGGYSGGTMERPALKRLMADIEAGRVDVVVVYKVDRLTRALSDFAKLVEVFDRREVSFVSITQQFNTTTSMGRLIETKQLIERAGQIAAALADGSPDQVRPLVTSLVRRVEVHPESIRIEVYRRRLASVPQSDGSRPSTGDGSAARNATPENAGDTVPEDVITLTIAARLQRAGREMRMIVQNTQNQLAPDPALLRALARAHDFRERLMRNPHLSAHDIARAEGVSAAYIYATLKLAWLAPDIVDAIVNGRQPPRLTATELFRLSGHLPLGWPQQRTLIGFASAPAASV